MKQRRCFKKPTKHTKKAEIRELFNYAPLPDDAGKFTPIRGEYKDVNDKGNGEDEKDDE